MVRLVITFDISSEHTYNKLTKILKTYGYRVQKSVYEVKIYQKDIDKVSKMLANNIDTSKDSLAIYNLGKDDRGSIIRMGVMCDIKSELIDNGYIII